MYMILMSKEVATKIFEFTTLWSGVLVLFLRVGYIVNMYQFLLVVLTGKSALLGSLLRLWPKLRNLWPHGRTSGIRERSYYEYALSLWNSSLLNLAIQANGVGGYDDQRIIYCKIDPHWLLYCWASSRQTEKVTILPPPLFGWNHLVF